MGPCKTLGPILEKLADEFNAHVYTRGQNPTVEIVAKKVAALPVPPPETKEDPDAAETAAATANATAEAPKEAAPPDLLAGVQRRLQKRSGGKFYGDGWSTARSPRSTYLITSLLMLVLIALVFFILVPWGGGALP